MMVGLIVLVVFLVVAACWCRARADHYERKIKRAVHDA